MTFQEVLAKHGYENDDTLVEVQDDEEENTHQATHREPWWPEGWRIIRIAESTVWRGNYTLHGKYYWASCRTSDRKVAINRVSAVARGVLARLEK